jgi:hypothetical protein
MSIERKPEGREISIDQANTLISRLQESQKEFSLPSNTAALTKGKEFMQCFVSCGASQIDLCFGMNDANEVVPVYLFQDANGTTLAAFNFQGLCPPYCRE